MTKHTFSVQPRTLTGRAVKQLRRQQLVPGSIFGKQVNSVNLQFSSKAFQSLRKEIGESALIYLTFPDQTEHPVIVREVATHPVTGELLHVSFNQVSLKEKVVAPVSVKLVGESSAVQDKQGILVQQVDEVEIEALPTDLPEALEVDISSLKAVDDAITVGDLVVDTTKLHIETPTETVIVKIEPLAAEEAEPAPAATEGETPAPTATDTPAAEPTPSAAT